MSTMRKTVYIQIIVVLTLAALWPQSAAAQSTATPPGPRITFHENAAGVKGAKLRLYLKSSPERVWEVVTNPQKAAKLFERVTAIKNSNRGAGFREYHLNSILGDKLVICRIIQDNERRRVTWKRVDGNLVDMEGYYRISDDAQYPGYVRLEYASYIDPGGIGRALMTNRGRRRDINYMITKLRTMTE